MVPALTKKSQRQNTTKQTKPLFGFGAAIADYASSIEHPTSQAHSKVIADIPDADLRRKVSQIYILGEDKILLAPYSGVKVESDMKSSFSIKPSLPPNMSRNNQPLIMREKTQLKYVILFLHPLRLPDISTSITKSTTYPSTYLYSYSRYKLSNCKSGGRPKVEYIKI